MSEPMIVTLKGKDREMHWPAWKRDDGLLVDLRLFENHGCSRIGPPEPNCDLSNPPLVFRPDALREAGIDEALIELAAQSEPQGFVLMPS